MLPFYGSNNPRLFEIERAAMDRPGLVIEALDQLLPDPGLVVDIGAGDGFTAQRLQTEFREVVPVEPSSGMRRPGRPLPWVGGVAQQLPFYDGAFDAAYATWAYFFTGGEWDPTPGLAELDRIVEHAGPIVIVDNLGGDEFTALGGDDVASSPEQWASFGFECTPIETVFEFTAERDARELLTFYFGPLDLDPFPLSYSYRVGVYVAGSRGA